MMVYPKPGFKYRHTRTRQLVSDAGFEADPHDLDIARGLNRGDLTTTPPVPPAAPVPEDAAPADPEVAPSSDAGPADAPADEAATPAKPPIKTAKGA